VTILYATWAVPAALVAAWMFVAYVMLGGFRS
jgi:hypothetical protein